MSLILTLIIWIIFILCTFFINVVLVEYLSKQQMNEDILKKVKIILYILFSLCFIWAIVHFSLSLLIPNKKFLIGTWGTAPFFQVVFNFLAYISINILYVFDYYLKTKHNIWDKTTLSLKIFGLTIILLISNVFCIFLDEGKNYSFTSPDNNHTIVVNEHNFFQAGWVTVYERNNPLIVSFYCQERTDDGYLPILSEDYNVTWEKEKVTFTFGDGQGGEEYITILFDE